MEYDYSSDDASNICGAFNAMPIWADHAGFELLYRDMPNLQTNDSDSDDDPELETNDSKEDSITGNFRMENMSLDNLGWQESSALHLDISIDRIPPS